MNKFIVCIFLALCLLMSASSKNLKKNEMSTEQQQPAQGCVHLFTGCNYGGNKIELCQSQNNFVDIQINDVINSIKVGPDTIATLYENTEYDGINLVLNQNQDFCSVNTNWQNFASSVVVERTLNTPGCYQLYEHCDFKGQAYYFCQNQQDLTQISFNDAASSVKLAPSTSIQVFEDSNYQGNSAQITSNNSCLVNIGYNDSISSVQVTNTAPAGPAQGCAWFYESCQFQGLKVEYCNKDVPDLSVDSMDDKISSAKVGPNTTVTGYQNKNYKGISQSVTTDIACLPALADNQISSLKVKKN